MADFPGFFGNAAVTHTLAQMVEHERVPQTILLGGPEGVGKATLARHFAASMLGSPEKIERDDLSLPANVSAIDERDKWTSDKRGDDPLLFSSHPDFITFPPDGPLRQITMQQMRTLRERAQLKPLRGSRRVFLIDHLERANEQSANSLLKILEEPPPHLVIVATTENLYDLLPTIRSRSVVFQLCRLADNEMADFAAAKGMTDAPARIALAEGCPGIAATIDLQGFRERRDLVLSALECGAGVTTFADWVQKSEPFSARRSEKLDAYLRLSYGVLNDVLRLLCGEKVRTHRDATERISSIASRVTFSWVERAVRQIDELVLMVRRNIQKTSALDAFVISLRNPASGISTSAFPG